MKKIVLIFLLFISLFSNAQTYNNVVPDSIVDNFMKWKIENDTIKREGKLITEFSLTDKLLIWKFEVEKMNSIFVETQKKNYGILFNNDSFGNYLKSTKNINFINSEYENSILAYWQAYPYTFGLLNKKTKYKCEYSLSFPVFTFDFNYAAQLEFYYCSHTCGHSQMLLYRRNQNKKDWQFIGIIE